MLVDHLVERERGVLELVRAGITTVPDVVAVLDAGAREELRKPAGRSVWGHLVKLSDQGQVAAIGGGPMLLDSVVGPISPRADRLAQVPPVVQVERRSVSLARSKGLDSAWLGNRIEC